MLRVYRVPFLIVVAQLVLGCEPAGHSLFASPQSNPLALSPDGSRLYVANTTSNSLSVIDTASRTEVAEIPVGLEPVSVAVRPDGAEVWVANHVSDSVSVIDTDPQSPTLHLVVETVQDLSPLASGGVTAFDEPVGIAFASNAKAYVALSSRNQVAIVDVATYSATGTLAITAQDPRAIAVRDGRLYVAAFESGNQSELSLCLFGNDPPQCTMGFQEVQTFATQPNLPGFPKNIVRDPDVPDRDLFVFDTTTDQLVGGSPVENVGTLLYGVAVGSGGSVYVSNTDARNHHLDGNGLAALPPEGQGLGLADLGNRVFRNRITRIGCNGVCGAPESWDLEPEPGQPVPSGSQLATPYGIAVTEDDQILITTAAASSRIASVDATSGAVLDRLDVGAIPRGVVVRPAGGGTHTAWVLNTLDNSVSVVAVAANGGLSLVETVVDVGSDPTPEDVRTGRIAFNDANASSTGTFACASCHPDAHVDQLLWVIGPKCHDCEQEEPRSTMSIRGLRATLPLHWDGTLGDPFGGPNGDVGTGGSEPANCDASDPAGCFRQLVDASLSGVMCSQPCDQPGPSGLPGRLDGGAREDMASFLENVSSMPARSRPIDDLVSASAAAGFADFFMDQGGGGGGVANTCADTTGGCHALPLGTSTNSPVVGAFDAPTMRGMTDRFLQFSMGITGSEEILDAAGQFGVDQGVIPWNPAVGMDELTVFSAAFTLFNPVYNVLPDDIFQMFEEASTGYSGALGRQVSVNARTATGALAGETDALLAALEAADDRRGINLRGAGQRLGQPILLAYEVIEGEARYRDEVDGQLGALALTRQQILAEAGAGDLVATFTGELPLLAGHPDGIQPLIAPESSGDGPTGDPALPVLPGDNPIRLAASNVHQNAVVAVNGQLVDATVSCIGGTFEPLCTGDVVEVELAETPSPDGLHLLQVVTDRGLASNELPICVGPVSGCL